MSRLSGLYAERVYNPPAILDGDDHQITVTVPGARLGDFVWASYGVDIEDLQLSASVTTDDTVTAVLSNSTGVSVDVGSATSLLRVKVVPFDAI